MPESKKSGKVIWPQKANPAGGRTAKRSCIPARGISQMCKYLTPVEIEKAKEEGWSRIRAEIAGDVG